MKMLQDRVRDTGHNHVSLDDFAHVVCQPIYHLAHPAAIYFRKMYYCLLTHRGSTHKS